MGLLSSKKAVIGMALMIVGTLAMLPGTLPNSAQVMSYAVVVGAGALTLGTWLVGTSEEGRPV